MVGRYFGLIFQVPSGGTEHTDDLACDPSCLGLCCGTYVKGNADASSVPNI